MDLIYNFSAIIVGLGVPLLAICLLAFLLKPHLLNTRIKKEWSRKRIFTLGVAAIFLTLFSFSGVMAATEPESVKLERLAQQQAAERLKRDTEEQARKLQLEAERAKEAEASRPKTRTLKEIKTVEFSIVRKDDSSLPKGEERVSVKGSGGERTVTYEVTYVKDKETGRRVVSDQITKAVVDEVVLVGTYAQPVSSQSFSSQAQQSEAAVYYTNCSAARAAGAAPVYVGEPGYGRHLDRDNDGIGCE